MIYITGDTHRNFSKIKKFCKENETTKEDTLIILGDSGINYYGNDKGDIKLKKMLRNIPITFFIIRGNHDNKPQNISTYKKTKHFEGPVFCEPEFPSLIFAIDGEIYNINNKNTMVIGGAYSVDKHYRLAKGWKWFPDEQISKNEMAEIDKKLEKLNWNIDIMLTHTAPLKYEPREAFLSTIDQSTVDRSMEMWLDWVEDMLEYEKWYFGHYHINKKIDKMICLFQDILSI